MPTSLSVKTWNSRVSWILDTAFRTPVLSLSINRYSLYWSIKVWDCSLLTSSVGGALLIHDLNSSECALLLSSADVVSIEKTNENFRIIYDVKGRFAIHRITAEEAKYKLCKVRKVMVGLKGVPSIVTSDGRTIRYPDPLIKVNDTVKISIDTGKIDEFIKFDSGEISSLFIQRWLSILVNNFHNVKYFS